MRTVLIDHSPDTSSISEAPWRWLAIAVFLLSNVLNFLDRQLLYAVAPYIRSEFQLSNAEYGELISVFALSYGIAVPFVGILLDRIGLVWGSIASVLLWSSATVMSGATHSYTGLVVSRSGLGIGESGALPSAGKASANYLPFSEWGLASALGSVAVMIGSILAPSLAAAMVPIWGWRSVFLFSGILGFIWAGIWKLTADRFPGTYTSQVRRRHPIAKVIGDRRMLALAASYGLVMVPYMFWMGWTTIYLVQTWQLTPENANRYFAWIPPIFATAGSFLSGGVVCYWIRRGDAAVASRLRMARWSAPCVLVVATMPWIPSAILAVLVIGFTLFICASVITSLNILPLDLFGRGNAGFTVALLACSFSLVQAFVSPLFGAAIDRGGFGLVCIVIAIFPLLGVTLLHLVLSPRIHADNKPDQ